jgi:NAD(P)-dependent dehydrogenase (short-subunit alcohol dehydrogenase family)
MSTLNDHVALVTGGGRSIGRATALARARARIAVTARTTVEEGDLGMIRFTTCTYPPRLARK